jgi:hypothetical protein
MLEYCARRMLMSLLDTLRISNAIDETEIEDVEKALQTYGCSGDDFTARVVEDQYQTTTGLTPITGELTIKHTGSGKEQVYQVGHGSTWVAEFERDLKNNTFS